MGRNSYLGGSTLVYAGKSWSSNDDVETPAVIWGRHLRHLESLAKAELEERRQALLQLLVPIVDHVDALQTVAYRVSNSESADIREKSIDVAAKMARDVCAMMADFILKVKEFDSPGPKILRTCRTIESSRNSIQFLLDQQDDCFSFMDWRHVWDATYILRQIPITPPSDEEHALKKFQLLISYNFY